MGRGSSILLLLALIQFASCKNHSSLFENIPSTQSGVHFNNIITESDSVNVLDLANIYNGGGVGIGDFNNDGLQDIYFTGNMVSNKLYLNKGDFRFEDITDASGATGEHKWCRGVAVIDINNDGLLDLYICSTISKDSALRQNILYINQGMDKNGIPHFKDMANEYGLNDNGHSTQAAFFDYDNDGDLDVYIATNEIISTDYPNHYRPSIKDGSHPSTGRLYRNDWDSTLHHPVFTNVTKAAGVTIDGYAHSVEITDINKDGWKDIYVTNDFLSNDLLYINNHNGTFTESLSAYFKHTSNNAMGVDITDINNDGLEDVFVLDMNPEDNYRKKMMLGGNNYLNNINNDQFGYNYQYVRNTLQLNRGRSVNSNDSIGNFVFSDIGFYAGVAETDWSWTPMITDFDNDGFRDIIITNGFPKDVSDHDFVAFRDKAFNIVSKEELLKHIPQVKLHNYAFHNNGNLTFSDMSSSWGFSTPTFSNGAAYADLDNDGDMDLVINNINDEASIIRNMTHEKSPEQHYLNVQCIGDSLNKNALGAFINVYYKTGHQVYEYTPYRGYLSSLQNLAHFGLGSINRVDSVVVNFPNGNTYIRKDIQADQLLVVRNNEAVRRTNIAQPIIDSTALFADVTSNENLHYKHAQDDYIDFNVQKLLPHKFSEYGPAIAVGDVDGNGTDDLVVGGAAKHSAEIMLQFPDGKFQSKSLLADSTLASKKADDLGLLLFDADNDGDLDLLITSGGSRLAAGDEAYNDKLYINDGKGNFSVSNAALPHNPTNKLCVKACDYDHDGRLDLFISERVMPGQYPKPVSGYIYHNDSKNNTVHFTDVTAQVAPMLQNMGMICDAIFTDFNNDGWCDLIVVGEFMPITILQNKAGHFVNIVDDELNRHNGWWNSISAADIDNDGDIDYVIGNLGTNSFYRASAEFPVSVYAKDFDHNGIYDAIPSLYLPGKDGTKKEVPAHTRDELLRQINALRKKFPNYADYANATMEDVLTPADRKDALILRATDMKTSILRNDGNGKFSFLPLPAEAQFSMINGLVLDDFNGDGNIDILANGNDFGTEPFTGRYDALNGLLLLGDGKCGFMPQSILKSGVFISGNGKALASLRGADGKIEVAASQNRGPMKIFSLKTPVHFVTPNADDQAVIFTMNGNKTKRMELYYGTSFLSQSTRSFHVPKNATVDIINTKGQRRRLSAPLP